VRTHNYTISKYPNDSVLEGKVTERPLVTMVHILQVLKPVYHRSEKTVSTMKGTAVTEEVGEDEHRKVIYGIKMRERNPV